MENEQVTIKVPVYEIILIIGIIMTIIGILAPLQRIEVFGMTLWLDPNLWILAMLGMALVWGYITNKILKGEKGSFLLGVALGIIGVIIAICKRTSKGKTMNNNNVNDSNKYEDMAKLVKLKQDGIITEMEFEIEKAKILK